MVQFRRTLIVTLLPTVVFSDDDKYFKGEGTSYRLKQVSDGNCHLIGNSTRNCGRCAQVSCDDPRCSDTTTTEIVYIVDRCLECKEGDLDLSTTVFQKVTGSRDSSRYNIKWKYVDCPVNANEFSQWVANMKIAHQSVTMVESCYYFLLDGGSNVDMSAVPIELTSIAGETISETLNLSSNHCTEGMSNFGSQNTKSMQLMPVSSDTSSSSKP
ncbi:putative expansin/pollen allergen, DPBB domain, RlpA-like domain superfamily [Plasmopara halstedii]